MRSSLVVVLLAIVAAACSSASTKSATLCADGIERFSCTDAWQTELASHLSMRDPDVIMGTDEQGDDRSTEEQLNAAAEFQRFSLAVTRANQACARMQGHSLSVTPFDIPAELADWLLDNVCPGDASLLETDLVTQG